MRYDPSPLETLASYAIVFAVGAISTAVVRLYGHYQYRKGRQHAQKPTAN